MARTRIKAKGTTKVVPVKRTPVKPRYSSGKGGLLTEKIVVTVRKEKGKNKTNTSK